MSRSSWFAALGILATLLPLAFSQASPSRPTYEVASIHPSDPAHDSGSVEPLPNGVGYTVDGLPLRSMLSVMYRIPLRQISGGPDWVNTENFDVYARTDHTDSIDKSSQDIRNLLADGSA